MREDEGAGGYTRKIIEERSKIGVNLWDSAAGHGSIAHCRVCSGGNMVRPIMIEPDPWQCPSCGIKNIQQKIVTCCYLDAANTFAGINNNRGIATRRRALLFIMN